MITKHSFHLAKLFVFILSFKVWVLDFYMPDTFPVAQPTVSKHCRGTILPKSSLSEFKKIVMSSSGIRIIHVACNSEISFHCS